MKNKSKRIAFDVASCSGEDEEHPASQLHQHTSKTTGWQSPKFSEYPQELLLRFKGDTYVDQIQFLSDSCRIATKIEVFISEPTRESSDSHTYYTPETATWKRLGYLSLSTNEATDYIARELRTVHANCVALYLRLVLHKCHVNPYNLYNQVGLVALNIIGRQGPEYKQSPTPYHMKGGVAPSDPSGFDTELELTDMKPPEATGEADHRYSHHFDPTTQRKIRELTEQKMRAVKQEDYDTAKRMKDQIDKLTTVGSRLLLLENQKKVAVQKEDYDLAKSLKQQIDELRTTALGTGRSGYSVAHPAPALPPPVCLPPMPPAVENTPTTILPQDQSHTQFGANPLPPLESSREDATPPKATKTPSPPKAVREHGFGFQNNNVALDERPAISRAYLSHIPVGEGNEEEEAVDMASSKKWWDVEEVVNAENPFNTAQDAAPSADAAAAEALTLSDWERDLKERVVSHYPDAAHTEPLTEAKKQTAGDMFAGIGQFATRCLFAKKWQSRDAAIRSIAGKIGAGSGDQYPIPDPTQATVLLFRYLVGKNNGLNDAVAAVQTGAIEAVKMLLKSKPAPSVQPSLHHIAAALVIKAADPNQRTRETSVELLMLLATSPVFGAEKVCSVVLHEEKEKKKQGNTAPWRPLQARYVRLFFSFRSSQK